MRLRTATILASLLLAVPASADELSIGAAGPLSGPQAVFGTTWHNGIKIYFEEVNAAGGIDGDTLTLVQLDDKADPREGTLVAQRFCDDDAILAVIGHFNSGVVQATLPIYNECGMPDVIFGSNPALTQQGFDNVFRPVANDFAQAGLPATYSLGQLKAEKAAVVHDKQVFGQGVADIFTKNFEKGGGKITSVSGINPTDVDFTALITQLKSEQPDVVYLGAVMPQLALFAKQMHEQGLEARLFVPDGGYTKDFIDQAGDEAAEGTIVSFQVPPMDASPRLQAFAEAYKAEYGEEVGPYSIFGYVLAQIVVEAIKNADSVDRAGILAALRSVKLETAVGPIEFDDIGELKVAPVFLYEVVGEDFKLAASSD